MTLSEIKKIVDEKKDEINVEYKEDPGFSFCNKFLENNDYSSSDKFVNIDIYEACKCIYYIQNRDNKTLEEVCSFIDSFSDYFKANEAEDVTSFIDMIFYFAGFNDVDSIIEYLNEKSDLKARFLLNRFNFINPDEEHSPEEAQNVNDDHKYLLRMLRRTADECDVVALIRAVCDNQESMCLIMALINVQKRMQKEKDELLTILEYGFSIKAGTSERN